MAPNPGFSDVLALLETHRTESRDEHADIGRRLRKLEDSALVTNTQQNMIARVLPLVRFALVALLGGLVGGSVPK